jgi:hypothetical protein
VGEVFIPDSGFVVGVKKAQKGIIAEAIKPLK